MTGQQISKTVRIATSLANDAGNYIGLNATKVAVLSEELDTVAEHYWVRDLSVVIYSHGGQVLGSLMLGDDDSLLENIQGVLAGASSHIDMVDRQELERLDADRARDEEIQRLRDELTGDPS